METMMHNRASKPYNIGCQQVIDIESSIGRVDIFDMPRHVPKFYHLTEDDYRRIADDIADKITEYLCPDAISLKREYGDMDEVQFELHFMATIWYIDDIMDDGRHIKVIRDVTNIRMSVDAWYIDDDGVNNGVEPIFTPGPIKEYLMSEIVW